MATGKSNDVVIFSRGWWLDVKDSNKYFIIGFFFIYLMSMFIFFYAISRDHFYDYVLTMRAFKNHRLGKTIIQKVNLKARVSYLDFSFR